MKAKSTLKLAFVNLRMLLAVLLCSAGMLLALAAGSPTQVEQPNVAHMSQPVTGMLSVLNVDVRALPQVASREIWRPELPRPFNYKSVLAEKELAVPDAPSVPLAPMPAPVQNFPGLSETDNCVGGQCGSGIPPDTNGDVGPNHYIQAVNKAFGVFSKTGQRLASFTEAQLWVNSGCPNPQGDPVVLYDSMADRWILTALGSAVDASGNSVSPYYQCLAVSINNDPVSGGWYRYSFRMDTGGTNQPPVNTLNDYPKFGVWTDCLYYSANGYDGSSLNSTGGIWGTFPIKQMYAGQGSVTMGLGYVASTNDYFTMIPSNISGPASGLPPAGRLNYYIQESLTAFNFRVRTVTPGANCGGGGTLSAATTVSQNSYAVPDGDIVPQPSPASSTELLDSLGDQMMQKVQYRRVGSSESLWVTHTFRSSSTGPTGSQWAQIDVTGGAIGTTPSQQQKYDPGDGIYRWMSSIAADKDGNVALGYSTSSETNPHFPSIAYSGRLAGDAPSTLPQGETQLVAGSGAQINDCDPHFPCPRWGDYSSMSVDPDGCTFWYTSEYYITQTNGNSGAWNTRIGSFRFPSCGATPTPIPNGAVIGLVANANGKVVTAENAGNSPLIANRSAIGPWEQFQILDQGNGYVALRSLANGLYVTAENAGASPLIANRTNVGTWEQFQLITTSTSKFAMIARANGLYVTAENAGNSSLIANRGAIGDWEQFSMVFLPSGVPGNVTLGFQSLYPNNNAYVSAESAGSAPLVANRTQEGSWEQFRLELQPNGNVAIRSLINGLYVTAENAGASALIANRSVVGTWEQFQLFDAGNGTVALRALANGLYVSAANAGAQLIANRYFVGAGEQFKLVISLRAVANNKIVTAENAGARPLIANRDAIGTWEQFQFISSNSVNNVSPGYFALKANANNLYVTAENAGNDPLIANRGAIGTWEQFQWIIGGNGNTAIKALVNGLFVTAENAGASPLIANRPSAGTWEQFH